MKKLLTLVLLFGLIINLDVIACGRAGAGCSGGWGGGVNSDCCSGDCYLDLFNTGHYLCR